jgi:hypothetical protein
MSSNQLCDVLVLLPTNAAAGTTVVMDQYCGKSLALPSATEVPTYITLTTGGLFTASSSPCPNSLYITVTSSAGRMSATFVRLDVGSTAALLAYDGACLQGRHVPSLDSLDPPYQ